MTEPHRYRPVAGSLPIQILLVEDDDADAKAVRRAFKKAKVTNSITRCADGIEALAYLRKEIDTDGPPLENKFIVLSDVNMPRMSGHELINEMRSDKRLNKIVAFMLTTSNSPDDIEHAYNNNVAGYIVKQNAGEEFLNLVEMLKLYWITVELPAITH